MNIDWKRKNITILKWFGAGPAFLLYLILFNDMKLFENSVIEGLFLCTVFIIMPALAVFLIYWPQKKQQTPQSIKDLE